MKISGVEIRPGNNIEYDGSLWRAVKIQHTQPGKGGAYMQVELKNLIDGRKNNVRFRSAETVERIRLDTKDFQYLYAEGDMLVFMDTETYEQINLPQDLVGDASAFLQDGMMVMLEMYDERPISVQLPETVEATVVEADAVVKGQTASASYKPAILDNGVRVMVPPHIVSGTRIVVDVYEREYVKRADCPVNTCHSRRWEGLGVGASVSEPSACSKALQAIAAQSCHPRPLPPAGGGR